jgi:glyoxylase-like metal-dependent hydrolase (beta-lactamase superfamily II)
MGLKIQGLVTGELACTLGELMLNGGPKTNERPYGFDEKISMPDGTSFSGVRQPVPVWLITGGEKVILVDTGMGPADELISAYHELGMDIFCNQKPEWDLTYTLANIGLTADDIDIVFQTHLHFDHIANNERFTRAKFLVPSEEMDWALTPPHHGGSGPYLKKFTKHVRDVREQITQIGYEGEIIPGVKFFRVGAHSPGFTAIVVKTDVGRVALAGDVMLDNMNIKYNWPAGFYYRLDEFNTAFKRIDDEADIIIPGHDWIVWHDYQNGRIG